MADEPLWVPTTGPGSGIGAVIAREIIETRSQRRHRLADTPGAPIG